MLASFAWVGLDWKVDLSLLQFLARLSNDVLRAARPIGFEAAF